VGSTGVCARTTGATHTNQQGLKPLDLSDSKHNYWASLYIDASMRSTSNRERQLARNHRSVLKDGKKTSLLAQGKLNSSPEASNSSILNPQ